MAELQYVLFKLGDQTYTMELLRVKGIEQDYNIMPLPVAPPNIKGLINLRGEIIPVYSLRNKFNMVDDYTGDTKKLLVTNTHGVPLAFEVDLVVGIEVVNDSKISGVPIVVKAEETAYMDSIVNVNGSIMINVSVENILSESEVSDISKIIDENK